MAGPPGPPLSQPMMKARPPAPAWGPRRVRPLYRRVMPEPAGPQDPRPPKASVGPLQIGRPGTHAAGCSCERRACPRSGATLPPDFGRGLTGSAGAQVLDDEK